MRCVQSTVQNSSKLHTGNDLTIHDDKVISIDGVPRSSEGSPRPYYIAI